MSRVDAGATRVLVVYQHLPHYRFGVFDALQARYDLDVEFLADVRSRDGSIKTIEPAMLRHFTRLRNVWLGKFLYQRGLLGRLLRARPDVVIFLGDYAYVSTWVGAAAARLLGVHVLFWTIGWHRPESGKRRVMRLAFYRLANALMLYGNTAKDIGRQMGYPSDRMFVIGNSDESSLRLATPASEQVADFVTRLPDSTALAIGGVIRLNAVKGLHLVVEVAATLRAAGMPVVVLLVGDGPSRAELGLLAARLDVPIYLPGPAYSVKELELAYERIKVCVIPSVAGLAVLQALRFGRPVVTHDDPYEQAPESEAILPGVTGDFYVRGDTDDLAVKVREWLHRVSIDPDAVSLACRDSLAADWSPASQVSRMVDAMTAVGVVLNRPA